MPKAAPKNHVLVLMPFNEQFRDVYDLGIKQACKDARVRCTRIDEQHLYDGTVIEHVYDQIAAADLIISDMTGKNANVFYETGYARALGKKMILLTQHAEEIPFDTQGYPHIVYEGKITKLKSELTRQVRDFFKRSAAAKAAPAAPPAPPRPYSSVYASRSDARKVFEEIVSSDQITYVYISGISLRDFLTEHGGMSDVWRLIKERLGEEAAEGWAGGTRLRVRLLLLDPQSGEGFFRYGVEKPLAIKAHGDVNAGDITSGLNEIEEAVGEIYGGRPQDFLEARLYEHCPFSFTFLTNRSVFVEQYLYLKARKGKAELPLLEYDASCDQYALLQNSFKVMWEHAHAERITIGTATPIQVARIKNIYRVNKRDEQERRQIESIREAKSGTVDILTITGRFFSNKERDALDALTSISSPGHAKPVKVRIALLNPVCQQAIYRAVADCCPVDAISQTLRGYGWKAHKKSNLYDGVHKTIHHMSEYINRGHAIELRLYSCSTANSLLLTPDSAYVGTYLYGRSEELQRKELLKSEYPLIEYSNARSDRFDNTERQILRCTFDVIWSCYSLPYEEYEARISPREEEEFNKSLHRVREELGLPASTA